MRIICDTPIPLLWANAPSRLSASAAAALEKGRQEGQLAIADISLWELALLIDRGRLHLPDDVSPPPLPAKLSALFDRSTRGPNHE
jgi:PIN domain nuclease of toxin-antitoxin system